MRNLAASSAALLIAITSCWPLEMDPSEREAQDEVRAAVLARRVADLERLESSAFQPCLLGTSCLALDPRPFEVCLVAAERCPRDAGFHRILPADGSEPSSNNRLQRAVRDKVPASITHRPAADPGR
jgi:hypothetical protein